MTWSSCATARRQGRRSRSESHPRAPISLIANRLPAEIKKVTTRLPNGLSLELVRWHQKPGGGSPLNHYTPTSIGSVVHGLDAGASGETYDVLLLPRARYGLCWSHYVEEDGAFDCVNRPKGIFGPRTKPLGVHHG